MQAACRRNSAYPQTAGRTLPGHGLDTVLASETGELHMTIAGNNKSVGFGRMDLVALSKSIENTIGTKLNDAGAKLNLIPLEWRLDTDGEFCLEGRHPYGRAHAGAVSACEDWAFALGFAEYGSCASDAYRVWTGRVGEWAILLFAVSDEALYHAEFPDDTSRSADLGTGPSAD
jgi:hypothetical protein